MFFPSLTKAKFLAEIEASCAGSLSPPSLPFPLLADRSLGVSQTFLLAELLVLPWLPPWVWKLPQPLSTGSLSGSSTEPQPRPADWTQRRLSGGVSWTDEGRKDDVKA